MAEKLFNLNYPSSDKIWSRTSTVARSMSSTLMPRIAPTNDEQNNMAALLYFGEQYENLNEEQRISIDQLVAPKGRKPECVYCGSEANHLDHLFPLIGNQQPSGFCTEPVNLVPCCGSCNQSKGSRRWYEYMDLTNYILTKNGKKFISKNCNLSSQIESISDEKLRKRVIKRNKLQEKNANDLIYIMNSIIKDDCSKKSLLDYIKGLVDGYLDGTNNTLESYIKYLNRIDQKDLEALDKVLIRLLKKGHKQFKTRKKNLDNYCDKYHLPSTNKPEESAHMLSFQQDFLKEWNELFENIKNALAPAQIQIDAFNGGIKDIIMGNDKNFINYYKGLFLDKRSRERLKELGFEKERKDIVSDVTKSIVQKAEALYNMGYDYAGSIADSEQIKIYKRLYKNNKQ